MVNGNKQAAIQLMNGAMHYFAEHNQSHESRLTLYKLAMVIYNYEQQRYTWPKPDIFVSLAEACQYATLENLENIAAGKTTVEYYEKPIPQYVFNRAKVIWQAWLDYRSHQT